MHYKWTLKEANFTKDKGKVFSCFSCGGWSTMWYKLAWFDVIWAVDIDPEMMKVYRENHNPKYSFVEWIQSFKSREDLPQELFELDILDGSPPCSSFSIAWNREKDWWKKKKFREGQAEQVLDTLFFDFIDLAKRLQPKVVVAENVKWMLIWEAQKYVAKVIEEFELAWYNVQFFLMDWSKMWVPQRRERVFFIALRNDLCEPFLEQYNLFEKKPFLKLDFNEREIPYKEIEEIWDDVQWDSKEYPSALALWEKCEIWKSFDTVHEKDSFFSYIKVDPEKVLTTITANVNWWSQYHYAIPRTLSAKELIYAWTFPEDYNFLDVRVKYLVWMSVPPLMTWRIAKEIYEQWLCKM